MPSCKKPTDEFIRLMEQLAPPKPSGPMSECIHGDRRKIRLCAGTGKYGLANAGRWYSRCWRTPCKGTSKEHVWHTDPLDRDLLHQLTVQWAFDHGKASRHAPRALTEFDESDSSHSESDSVPTEEDTTNASQFTIENFLSRAKRDFMSGEENIVRVLYWVESGCTPLSFVWRDDRPRGNLNVFSLSGDIAKQIILNGCLSFAYWDVVTGAWLELDYHDEFIHHRGEILCFKKSSVTDCPGITQLREYHQFIFNVLGTGQGLKLHGDAQFGLDMTSTPLDQVALWINRAGSTPMSSPTRAPSRPSLFKMTDPGSSSSHSTSDIHSQAAPSSSTAKESVDRGELTSPRKKGVHIASKNTMPNKRPRV